MNKDFIQKMECLRQRHEQLLQQRNLPVEEFNGIVQRYTNPVLTRNHIPLEWRYDFNPDTNPYCMERIKAFTLKHGGKTSFFYWHHQFLPLSHPYRKQKDKFLNGRIEKDLPPPRLSGEEMLRRVCVLPTITFGIQHNKYKIGGFGEKHNWVKRSIFWELPYWHTNLIRHNLDVMHIERNVFENLFNTVMDINGKTKDNVKARMDLKLYCIRPELELIEENGKVLKPKASYALTKDQKEEVCHWVKQLRFPDGYSSNIGRCVNLEKCKFYGLKSHDCHMLIQRLMPIAFHELLPQVI